MNQSEYEQNRLILDRLMKQVSIANSEQLSEIANVSGLQIKRLQYGLIEKLSVETILKLANALQISISQLLAEFGKATESRSDRSSVPSQDESPQFWQQEYQRLEKDTAEQATILHDKFQQASIQTIESWLIQWPTAVAAIAKNPDLPAARLIPLVNPVQELIEKWHLETIATVGAELAYDPQWHELMTGSVEPGAIVKVRYVGYKKAEKLLYKAKVSPL